jgi:cytochrome c
MAAFSITRPSTQVPAAQTPARFGFGRPATPTEIAKLDIDVRPDGAGLPEGSGTSAQGRPIFVQKCGACHGNNGQGSLNDRLVDREPRDHRAFSQDNDARKTIGNYWPYATTLYDYIGRSMPFTEPGSLTPDEVYSVVAYLLTLNEIIGPDEVMDRHTLPKVVMPARDRFVPDDRRGGHEVKE